MNENTNETPNTEETIFTEEEFLNHGYDKHIRQARNCLFVIAIIQVIFAVYTFAVNTTTSGYLPFLITLFIAVVFAGLGFWTKKKPYTALVTALILYIVLWISDCIVDPTYFLRGIILKIAIIVYISKGLADAKEAQQMKNAMNNNM